MTGPRLVALGTVQDGGLPHAGCSCERCAAARTDPSRRRSVASLGLVLPAEESGGGDDPAELYLVDATPDLMDQLHRLAPYGGASPAGRIHRSLLSGVLLTHAHIGHYLGLAQFGFEVMHTSELPVYCTPAMAEFLRSNAPWDQLVALRNVDLRETEPGAEVELGRGVSFRPLLVPHRNEYADTVGYLFSGPRRTVLYVPDTDSWAGWPKPVTEVVAEAGVDVAVVDATFFSMDELPGRDITKVRHPLIVQSLELFGEAVDAGRLAVYFTHLNHTNRALDPVSDERRQIEEAGFRVLEEGEELPL